MSTLRLACAASLLVAGVAPAATNNQVNYFEQIASYGVTGGIAEIVAASPNGQTLAFSDAAGGRVGFVNITDPTQPTSLPSIATGGEPTSVAFAGRYVVAAVISTPPQVGQPYPDPASPANAGALFVIDTINAAAPVVLGSVPIGFQPDSVKAVLRGGQIVAVVCIENQPIVVDAGGLVVDEDAPGFHTSGASYPQDRSLPGLVQVVTIDPSNVAGATVANVSLPAATLSAAGLLYAQDPQPEFVDVYGNLAAVSLQENNGIAIIDFTSSSAPTLVRVFSAGHTAERLADLSDDDAIALTQGYPSSIGGAIPAPTDGGDNPVPGGPRMPDSVAFSSDGTRLYTADEGELAYTGGRGWSAFSTMGSLLFSDVGDLERTAVRFGHYPDGRSDARGIEVEGITTARIGNRDFAFAVSERGSFMAVYWILPKQAPRFVQLLPTGISPEGIIAIPGRALVITADEVSGTLTIFRGRPSLPNDSERPLPYSQQRPFGALSGITPAPGGAFAVPDNALPTTVYHVGLGTGPFAQVRPVMDVMREGVQARYDGEGIVRDSSILAPSPGLGGFFLASEGNGTTIPNLIVQVNSFGSVQREIQFPNNVDAGANPTIGGSAVPSAGGGRIRSNGFEGLTLVDGRYIYACVQRSFSGESATHTRIARYDLQQIQDGTAPQSGLRTGGDWKFFFYPLQAATGAGFIGLSEITSIGNDQFLVIERDQGVGTSAQLKAIYAFSVAGLIPDTNGLPGEPGGSDTVTKVLAIDVRPEFFPFEKVESAAILNGHLWVGLDNDGGEVANRFVDTGTFLNPLSGSK